MSMLGRPRSCKLVESYRRYARAVAFEVLRKLPSHMERSDIQSAELGLAEAAAAYDGRACVHFKTLAC